MLDFSVFARLEISSSTTTSATTASTTAAASIVVLMYAKIKNKVLNGIKISFTFSRVVNIVKGKYDSFQDYRANQSMKLKIENYCY